MLTWIVRAVLILAGLVTSLMVAKDEPDFSVIQMTIAILLCALVLFVLAFWPKRWTVRVSRPAKPPPR